MTDETNAEPEIRGTEQHPIRVQIPVFPINAVEFFCVFSRFEFALKKGGFIRGNPGQPAWPDWHAFSRLPEIQCLFAELSRRPRVRYIIENPPKTQIVREHDGRSYVEWEAQVGRVENIEMLIDAARQTRNNLFHGGKTAIEPVERAERNAMLIDAANEVLQTLLMANDAVRAIFLQEYDD